MQNQSPNQNNPANPLFKVCALTVDRSYPDPDSQDELVIPVSLNFKKSNDMRGRARTVDGQEVNVSFSLALLRASFDLSFQVDGHSDAYAVVDVTKVAFQAPLSASGKFKNTINSDAVRKKSKSIRSSLGAKARVRGIAAAFSGDARFATSSNASHAAKFSYHVNFPVSNIKVTSDGTRINWEIYPKNSAANGQSLVAPDYLDGEMFPSGEKEDLNCACFIRKKIEFRNRALIITGSVTTSLKDMRVDDIEFTDDLGGEVDWKDIKDGAISSKSLSKQILRSRELKKFLLKSIIRKHLVSQGMSIEGSCVEISKACT